MIIRLEQTTAKKSAQYTIKGSYIQGKANLLKPSLTRQTELIISISGYEEIYFQRNEVTAFKNIVSLVIQQTEQRPIIEHFKNSRGKNIGSWITHGTTATELSLYGKTIQLWRVSFRREGLFCCMYYDNELIGMIEKDLIVFHNLDSYTLYTEHEEYGLFLVVAALLWDIGSYRKFNVGIGYNEQTKSKIFRNKRKDYAAATVRPDILEKYDPDYIPRIRAFGSDWLSKEKF